MKIFKFFFLIVIFSYTDSFSIESLIDIKDASEIQKIEGNYYFLEDPTNKKRISEILHSSDFQPWGAKMLNLGISSSTFWIKLNIKNSTSSRIALEVTQPTFDVIEFYELKDNSLWTQPIKLGEKYPFYPRPYDHQSFIFDLNLKKETKTFFLKIENGEPIFTFFYLGPPSLIYEGNLKEDFYFGIYLGIMLVMILYNLFIFFSVRDKSYLYYVFFIFTVLLCHTVFLGFGNRYLWSNSPSIAPLAVYISCSICGIATAVFVMEFIKTKTFTPFGHKLLYIAIFLEILSLILALIGYRNLSYKMIDLLAMLGSLIVLTCAYVIWQKGFRPAKFFFIALSISLGCVIIFMLTNINIIPYTRFTNYLMPLGTAIETIMLSFALADRINILKKENEKKQLEVISALKENEKYLIAWREASLSAEKFKKESISVQFESLKNQVNPHFLFNSLNVLVELLYKDQDQAARFVNELAQVYRYVLDHKSKELVELDCELKFIEAFIFLLQIRFDKNLIIKNHLPLNTPVLIAPLTLQLLIENAIKHNVISEEDPLTIHIYLEKDYIVISNNIHLKFSPIAPSGIGLKNIQERYEFLSEKKIIIINDAKNFTVKIPIILFKNNSNNEIRNFKNPIPS